MTPLPDLAIRLRRAAFNEALRQGDLDGIRPLLAPNAVLVTGTDSAIISGRNAQLQVWKRAFASQEGMIYVRTPETIVASPIEPIAFEHGVWRGVAMSDGRTLASGSYTAKWRQPGDDWIIEAELYLTTA